MTWIDSKREALRLIDDIMRQYGAPSEIALTEYVSEASYREHKPHEGWPWKFHTAVTRAMVRELAKRGWKVRTVKL